MSGPPPLHIDDSYSSFADLFLLMKITSVQVQVQVLHYSAFCNIKGFYTLDIDRNHSFCNDFPQETI